MTTDNLDDIGERFTGPSDADLIHVPHLERWAENQRPKSHDWSELKLMNYVGTDLYQWWGKHKGSVFEDPFGVPFLITPRDHAQNYVMVHADENDPTKDGIVFHGTVQQADDCYGLRIGANESDLLAFAADQGWVVFKQIS